MYKLLLTFRYLRRKLIPLFAMVAVLLCTAMVIIVMSVMGGFLNLLRDAGHTVMGDVSVSSGLAGFPHYEELIAGLEELPQVAAAAPTIDAFGLLKIGDYIAGVQVVGIRGRDQAQVTAFSDILHWTPDYLASEPRIAQFYGPFNPVETALDMKSPWSAAEDRPVIVTGIEVNPGNRRRPDGSYAYLPSILTTPVTLSLLPITQQAGAIEPATDQFLVVNEFSSGVYDVDKQRVYIPFDVAQKMLLMAEAPRFAVNPDGSPRIENGRAVVAGVSPARCTEIQIKAAPGVTADQLRDAVDAFYHREFSPRHDDLPPFMNILTWEERQASFLAAVENEKRLMTSLFGVISIVAVAMVGVIFYMIVLEKTRDIGILRALGATKAGVAAIFLSFAAVLGFIGTSLGALTAFLIVYYINEIHAWLGDGLGYAAYYAGIPLASLLLGFTLGGGQSVLRSILEIGRPQPRWTRPAKRTALIFGAIAVAAVAILALSTALPIRFNDTIAFQIWDRSVYFFDRIPNDIDPVEVAIVMAIAVAASVVGALIPAVKAALVDPVESLRYE